MLNLSGYQELKGKFSDGVLRTLPCKNVCISLLKKVFSSFDLDVIITMDSTLAEGSECRFTVKKSWKDKGVDFLSYCCCMNCTL